MSLPKLETYPNKKIKRRFVSTYIFLELIAIYPTNKPPNFYTIRMGYEKIDFITALEPRQQGNEIISLRSNYYCVIETEIL